jgi:hypothetical protein
LPDDGVDDSGRPEDVAFSGKSLRLLKIGVSELIVTEPVSVTNHVKCQHSSDDEKNQFELHDVGEMKGWNLGIGSPWYISDLRLSLSSLC